MFEFNPSSPLPFTNIKYIDNQSWEVSLENALNFRHNIHNINPNDHEDNYNTPLYQTFLNTLDDRLLFSYLHCVMDNASRKVYLRDFLALINDIPIDTNIVPIDESHNRYNFPLSTHDCDDEDTMDMDEKLGNVNVRFKDKYRRSNESLLTGRKYLKKNGIDMIYDEIYNDYISKDKNEAGIDDDACKNDVTIDLNWYLDGNMREFYFENNGNTSGSISDINNNDVNNSRYVHLPYAGNKQYNTIEPSMKFKNDDDDDNSNDYATGSNGQFQDKEKSCANNINVGIICVRLNKDVFNKILKICKQEKVRFSSLMQYVFVHSLIQSDANLNSTLSKSKNGNNYNLIVSNAIDMRKFYDTNDSSTNYSNTKNSNIKFGNHVYIIRNKVCYDQSIKFGSKQFWDHIRTTISDEIAPEMIDQTLKGTFPSVLSVNDSVLAIKRHVKKDKWNSQRLFPCGVSNTGPTLVNPKNINDKDWEPKYKVIDYFAGTSSPPSNAAILTGFTIVETGNLNLSLNYACQLLSKEEAQSIADRFLDSMIQLAGE